MTIFPGDVVRWLGDAPTYATSVPATSMGVFVEPGDVGTVLATSVATACARVVFPHGDALVRLEEVVRVTR